MWDELERRMKNEQPKNEKELKEILLRVWQRGNEEVGGFVTKSIK
jgi:hypothetical protein